ncbi:hypothetical protein LDO31_05250 [Luteimonas sp. XNQY3]|nr:hypothetical protein [Luteimonas sp. XNQY3]MCD9005651.1 hypothetical protein [Luteimonas sp. XNQY3]
MQDRRTTRHHVAGLLTAGLTALAGCKQLPREVAQASRPSTPAAATPTPEQTVQLPTADAAPVASRQTGAPVPGTQIRVPRHGTAGKPLTIHAPPGSRVAVGDRQPTLIVPVSGRLDLPTPTQRGRLHLMVERPDASAMPFVVELD